MTDSPLKDNIDNDNKQEEHNEDQELFYKNIPGISKEQCDKFHKVLEEDLKGISLPLTTKFANNGLLNFGDNYLKEMENALKDIDSTSGIINKKETDSKKTSSSVPKKQIKKFQIKAKNQGELTKAEEILKMNRKEDNKCYKRIKETEKIPMNSEALFKNLEKIKQEVNDLKQINRDEELLRMQKENQEIEEKLNNLKNQDNTELRDKQEECHKLVEELNAEFNKRKSEAKEKERERAKAIDEIKKIQEEQKKHNDEIAKLQKDKKSLEETLDKLKKDVESYDIYKDFIDKVNAKYNNENSNQTDLYDSLKDKFECLMKNEADIQMNIEQSKKEQESLRNKIKEMKVKNDKQSQNEKLKNLEKEIKRLTDENKVLENQIDTHLKEKQKKDSDTHQIKLSILNLYEKAIKAEGKQTVIHEQKFADEKEEEEDLCQKLDKINEIIQDLIKIHQGLENNEKIEKNTKIDKNPNNK